MTVVYMGTPEFAVPALVKLHNSGYDVKLVVTKPDREKDRGKKLQPCEVKAKAIELGLEVESPENIKNNPEFLKKLRSIAPDFIVVAAYGKILPKEILELPKYGCINIHGSILPSYRGPAPIHRAVMNGDKETGVTLMHMAEGCDTGDMIAFAKTLVLEKTTEMLHVELANMGAELLIEQLPLIAEGKAKHIPQDDSKASYAAMVFKDEGVIDFNKTAEEICCLVRGFNSWPTASTKLGGLVMKVHEAKIGQGSGPAGTVLAAGKEGLEVGCKGGSVVFTRIQMPGKKAMDVSAFLLGNKIEIGTILG